MAAATVQRSDTEENMASSNWRGRKVLVTGHTGFKGGWLSLWLKSLGAEVVGFALDPAPGPNLFAAADVGAAMRSVIGDLRDPAPIAQLVADSRPEVIFHLAAQPLVRASYRDPLATYATNVMGTVHLLEAVRRVEGVRAVVLATTDKCYENREWVWPYRESDRLGGRDPYASSKACAELAASAYRESFFADAGIRIATVRAGNVIGGGDWAEDRLIPDLMRGAREGERVPIRAPRAIRPWQHVLDPLAGYLLLAERLCSADGEHFAEAWNFGPAPEDSQPVEWVVEQLAERWDQVGFKRDDRGDHPHEAKVLKLDSAKAIGRLGWRPRLSLDTALDWVADWYRSDVGDADVRALTQAQIARYESLATRVAEPAG